MKKFFSAVWKALNLPIVDFFGAMIFWFLGIYIAAEFCGMNPDVPTFVCAFFIFIGISIWGSFISKSFRKKEA